MDPQPPKRTFLLCWKKFLGTSREKTNINVLTAAHNALVKCHNVEQLTFVLHDLRPPETFPAFLSAVWTSQGPRLSKLSLNATSEKFFLLLDPNVSRDLARLTDLEVCLAVSRFSHVHRRDALIPHIFLPFIVSLKGTLESLTISSVETVDLTPLFHGLGHFPHLQKLDLHLTMTWVALSDPNSLTSFAVLHKDSLRHLSIKAQHSAELNQNDMLYEPWVIETLCNIELPVLESLTLDVFSSRGTIVPRFCSSKLPSLVAVSFTDRCINLDDLSTILEYAGDTAFPWKTLRLKVLELQPRLIGLLAAKLPHLEELELSCGTEPHRYPYTPLMMMEVGDILVIHEMYSEPFTA